MKLKQLHALLEAVDDAVEAEDHARALRLILSNFSKLSDTGLLRERVATVLASMGRKKEAVEVLDHVARHWANAGRPARSIAAIKQMHALRPDSTVLLDHFTTLYNIRSPYLSEASRPTDEPLADVELDLSGREPQLDEDELAELAHERAAEASGLATDPSELPPLPLLSLLPSDALRRVLDLLEYQIYADTERVINASQAGDLIWTVSPDFVLENTEPAYRLPSGTLVGLHAWGTTEQIPEHAVVSRKGSEILRLSREHVDKLDDELGDFKNRLATLRRHALTEGLLTRHPIFEGLVDEQRVALMKAFTGLRVAKGETLIAQQRQSPGIFLILDGKVDIVRNDDDWEITIATLTPGEVFGEVGVVSDKPALAACVTTTPGHLLYLPRDEFGEIAGQFPGLAKYAVNLANERLQDVETTLSAGDLELEE